MKKKRISDVSILNKNKIVINIVFCKHIYLKLISKRKKFNSLSYRRRHNWVLGVFNWEYAISFLYSILINSSSNITQVRVHHITSRFFLLYRLQDIFAGVKSHLPRFENVQVFPLILSVCHSRQSLMYLFPVQRSLTPNDSLFMQPVIVNISVFILIIYQYGTSIYAL